MLYRSFAAAQADPRRPKTKRAARAAPSSITAVVPEGLKVELLREPNHHQRKSDQKEEETWARTVVSLVPHFPLAFRSGEKISWKAKNRVIVPAARAELSRNGLNSDSLPPLFGQRAGVPYGCGDDTGETMTKLLNELGRTFTPCPLALADRDRREALRDQQSLTAAFFGDPLPGVSALDRRERERPSLTTLVPAV